MVPAQTVQVWSISRACRSSRFGRSVLLEKWQEGSGSKATARPPVCIELKLFINYWAIPICRSFFNYFINYNIWRFGLSAPTGNTRRESSKHALLLLLLKETLWERKSVLLNRKH